MILMVISEGENMKRIVSIFIMVIFMMAGCGSEQSSNTDNVLQSIDTSKPVQYISASYVINNDNYAELVGYYDYVFCGTVKEVLEIQYEETRIGGDNPRVDYEPYTVYRVEVLENIKGKLKKNKDVVLYKHGGLSKDQEYYLVMEGDCLPEVGKTYLFNSWVKENGELGISGPNSNIYICEAKEGKNVKSYDVYKQFVDAYKHEVVYDMERYEYSPKAAH